MATAILERTPRSVTVKMSTGRWNRIQQLERAYRVANLQTLEETLPFTAG